MTGLIPWLWFAQSVNRSTMSIVAGRALIMQVYIPKIILPTIVVCQDAIKQIAIFIPLLLFLYFYGISPSLHWFSIAVLAFAQLLFILACSYFVAAIVPFMHDFMYIVATGIQLMFFCSGVFYSLDSIPPQFKKWFALNPMATLLDNYRPVFMHHQWPNWWDLLLITTVSLLAILIIWRVIKYLDHIYPRVVL
jgi:lipopolysaccharide transport system permease protein